MDEAIAEPSYEDMLSFIEEKLTDLEFQDTRESLVNKMIKASFEDSYSRVPMSDELPGWARHWESALAESIRNCRSGRDIELDWKDRGWEKFDLFEPIVAYIKREARKTQ